MGLSQVSTLFPLAIAVGYALLLIGSLLRLGWQDRQVRWFLGFLLATIAWQTLLLPFPIHQAIPNLPVKALLLSTTLLGGTTAVYVDWPDARRWVTLGGSALLVTIFLDGIAAQNLLQADSALVEATAGGLLAVLAWLALNSAYLLITWRSYRGTRLPWHANRLLFWEFMLLMTLVSGGFFAANYRVLHMAGQTLHFCAVGGMAYAIFSHRIFDMRTRLRRSLAFLVIALLSAALAAAILMVTQKLTEQMPAGSSVAILVLAIAAGFLFYQPLHRLVERFLYHYLLGQEFDSGKALRSYSQAIARTLEVEELSLVAIGTVSQLLRADRGALLLISQDGEVFEIEPVPALGPIGLQKVSFRHDSLFIKALREERQPLLQYDIDFSPRLRDMSPAERSWLVEQAMDVYVPIATEAGLSGVIALGPKRSGHTYQPNELALLQVMADQTVVALQNARLYRRLEAQNERIRRLNADLRQQNDRLGIVDRVKSDFITIASHELRTPLSQVKGFADILQAMNDDNTLTQEQAQELASYINQASERLERLIAAMLDASQLDLTGLELDLVQTDLDTILEMAVLPLSAAMQARQITFAARGAQEAPPLVADVERLAHAFRNLIGNAVKYTPDGGQVTVSASLANGRDPSDYLEVVIADTGIGIDPRYHQLIFEKFFRVGDPQLHSTGDTKYKGGGPGLGLPIAKGVIEAHNGRIWVESEGEDEKHLPGSRFHVILPLCPSVPEALTEATPAEQPLSPAA